MALSSPRRVSTCTIERERAVEIARCRWAHKHMLQAQRTALYLQEPIRRELSRSAGCRLVQEEALFGGPPAGWGGAHGRIVDAAALRVGRGGVRTARREVRDRLPGHGREAGWRRSVGESTCKALR